MRKYSLLRLFVSNPSSVANLTLVLQIAAGHIPTSKSDFSAFTTLSGHDSSPAWKSIASKHGGFQPLPRTKTAFASTQQQLLQINSRFLLEVDLEIATLIESEILHRHGSLSPPDIAALMSLHARKGNTHNVESYFTLQTSLNCVTRESYWMLMQSCLKSSKSMHNALIWYHRLLRAEGVEKPGIRVFRMLVHAYVFSARSPDRAAACLMEYERMHLRAADEGMYELVMQEFNRVGRDDEVRKLMKRMLVWGLEPSVRVWNLYVLSMKDSGSVEDAEAVVTGMVEKGVELDVGTFYSLMEVYAGCNDMVGASDKCQEALRCGFVLSTRMWHVLFLGLLKNGDAKAFDKHFQSIRESCDQVSDISKLNSDQYFHSLYLKRYLYAEESQSAFQTAKEMLASNVYPRRFTYDLLMKLLIQHGHYSFAIQLFEQMQQSQIIGVRATFHNVLMAQLRNLLHCDTPLPEMTRILSETFSEMTRSNSPPTTDTYNTILASLVSLPTPDLAFTFLQSHDFKPNVITYTLLLKLVSPNLLASSFKKLTTLFATDAPSLDTTPTFDRIFFTALFSSLSSPQHQDPLQFTHFHNLFLNLVESRRLRPDAACFNSLLAGQLRLNLPVSNIKHTYETMVCEFKIPGTVRTFTTLMTAVAATSGTNAVLPVLLETGEIGGMEATPMGVYRGMLQCGIDPDLTVFRGLSRICVATGDAGMARDVMKEMRKWDVDEEEFMFRRVERVASGG
ncbi:hypothetical protein HDU98_006310 [Podochytrium sp. JEL0797]|nr:hypothetical protein HDU98_006310 [Podochytrium sp. JEL0797]